MNATKRLQIFERLRDVTPAPTTELHVPPPYSNC